MGKPEVLQPRRLQNVGYNLVSEQQIFFQFPYQLFQFYISISSLFEVGNILVSSQKMAGCRIIKSTIFANDTELEYFKIYL